MPAAARPYAFDEFAARAEAGEPAQAYSAGDLEAACEKARADAVESAHARELAEQTRLIAAMAERIEAAARERDEAVAVQAAALVSIARDIVGRICAGAAARDKGETALALLERYLTGAPDRSPARLVVCDATPEPVIAELKKAIAARGADARVSIDTSGEFAPGDCRIEWADGAMGCNLGDILAQIETIFAGIENDAAPTRTPKENTA